MLVRVNTAILRGIDGFPVACETDIGKGLPRISVVGLPEKSVREATERVRSAVLNQGIRFPLGRITVNFAPADVRKNGSHLDLSMAVGILAVAGEIPTDGLRKTALIGELSLDGLLRPARGVVAMILALREKGIRDIIIPEKNREEGEAFTGLSIYLARDLGGVIQHLSGRKSLPLCRRGKSREGALSRGPKGDAGEGGAAAGLIDFSEVRGHRMAKRAITVAAAGGHHILMTGSPSSGKTMLAERIPTILPPVTDAERIRIMRNYSVSGIGKLEELAGGRPIRRPPHHITLSGFLGGRDLLPGEVTLADQGLLFMDELGEFSRPVIESLRILLEKKEAELSSGGEVYRMPADFFLVAASNPCPCGYLGSGIRECSCSVSQIRRYQAKISGPVLDRIDISFPVMPMPYDELQEGISMDSRTMRDMVIAARKIQEERCRGIPARLNSELSGEEVKRFGNMTKEGEKLLASAYDSLKLNPRTLLKVRKVARTIADLNGRDECGEEEVIEALQYRQ